MIKNLWEKTELYCMNHKEPVRMYIYEHAVSPFYACPRYMRKDADHPDGHEENEPGCANRISFDAYWKIVDKFGEIMEADFANGEIQDYTGLRFRWKQIDVKILSYSEKKILIGVSNRKEIDSWH